MLPTIDLSYSQTLTQKKHAGRGTTRSFEAGGGRGGGGQVAQSMRHAHKMLQFENWNLIENNGTGNTTLFLELLPFTVIIFTICFIFWLLQREVASHLIHPRSEVGATKADTTCSITFL